MNYGTVTSFIFMDIQTCGFQCQEFEDLKTFVLDRHSNNGGYFW